MWTAKEFCDAIERQRGDRDMPLRFIDLDGRELPFRWMYGTHDGMTEVVVRLNVSGGEVPE